MKRSKTRGKLRRIYRELICKLEDKEFEFSTYVTGYDYKNECGTVCCIIGWFPKYYPKAGFYWVRNDVLTKAGYDCHSNIKAAAKLLGIDYSLACYLFVGDYPMKDAPAINRNSPLKEVKKAWRYIIDNWEERYEYDNYPAVPYTLS